MDEEIEIQLFRVARIFVFRSVTDPSSSNTFRANHKILNGSICLLLHIEMEYGEMRNTTGFDSFLA